MRDVYWSKLDFLIVDTPPGTSDEHLTVVSALKDVADGAVLVSTPSAVAVGTLGKELEFCAKLRLPVLGVVENMRDFVCPCCGKIEQVSINLSLSIFFFLSLSDVRACVFPQLFPSSKENSIEEFCIRRKQRYLGSVPIDTRMGHAADGGVYVACESMQLVCANLLAALPPEDDY